MAKLQQVIDLLVKAQFDKRDKEVLKGEIKDAFNQSVELDEESLRNIVSALNRVLGSVGKELNIDELIKMPSVDAWKKLGEVAGTTFVDAFNSSLQGIDNKSMQAVIEILQDIRNNQGVKVELFNKENLDAAMQSINNISAAVDKLVSNAHGKYYKTTEEINEALERSKNKIKDIKDALNYKSPVKAKYGGFEKVIDIYNEYMSKKGNSPWEEEYAALTKFMTAFSAFESKRKKDPDWIRNLEQENMWAKYKPMAELYKSRIGGEKERRSMLTDVINANNGINRASEPWAQEHTLIEVRDLLKNGLTVKETKKPTKEVVESQPKEGVESQPKENSKPQVSPTKKVAEDELMTLIRQLAGATKEGNNTQIENIDKEIINRYSEPIQKFIKNLLEDFDIGENDKQFNSAMSDLYKKLQSYDTVDAAANKKAFEINKENLTTLFKTLYRLNSFVENSKKNGVPEKKYSLSNSYVQKLTDFIANEDLIDQKKIDDIYNLIDELYDAPKENVKSIVEKLVNKTLEATIAPQTSAKSETLIENKTPINKEIILDENLTAKLNALTDAISSLAQNELNTLIDIIKSFQVKEDDSNNDINKLIQALISNQSDNERGAFLNSKSGKYIGFIEGDQDSVSASMDDYKQAAKQGYDTRIHSHTFLTAAPSVTGKANDIQNWINTFDYIKKHIIATQKELLSVDLSGLRKKQVEEIKEAYLAKAEPLMEAAPNNETLQLQLRQAFESVLKEKGLSNIMTSYKLNDVIADNFTKQSNGDIQSTINASIDPTSLKEAISDLAKDSTIVDAKDKIISAITNNVKPVDDPEILREIKQETGNQGQRFQRIQDIASDYEDVDDVEAAIKQFGEVYKQIVLMSDDEYKYIKPNKTGISMLKKIATGDLDLNDFSGIEFQRVEKPSTTTTQVLANNTDIVNAIGEVKTIIEKITPQSENPVDNHTVVDGTINAVSPSEANQIAQESTLKNIFDVLKQKNDSISEKEISQNENKPDETPIETKPVESLDIKKEKVDIEKVLQEITALTKKELITRNIRGTMDDVGLNQDSVYYGNSDIDNIIQKLEYSKSYLKKFDDPSTKKLISNFDDIIGLVASFQKDRDILKNKYNNNEISIDELDHNSDLVHFAGVFNDSVSDLMTNLPSPYDFQDRIEEILSDFTSEDYAEMAKIVEKAFDASVQKVAKIREELSAAKNELEDIQKISETYGYTSTMSAREAGRINSTLEKPVNKNVPNYSRNKYVIKMLKDGYLPQKYSDGYGFSNNDGSYYKITKTEYDYAVYLQETITKLNIGFDEGLQILKSQNGQLEAAIKKVNELEIAEKAAVQEQDAAYERQAIVHNNLAHIESNKEESETRKENIEVTKKIETTVVNEAAAHRENTDAIAAENNAIEKNILLLKEKAKQMSLSEWQESNQRGSELFAAKYDLYKAGHKEVITDDFWRQTQYEKPVNYTPISLEKASEILYDKISQSIYDGWYRNADSEYKPKIEASILGDDEIRNASLNNMWHAYEDFIGKSIDFFEFLNTEIPVYRGKNSENFTEDDTFISFSFDENIAKKFGDTVIQTLIKPIETLGNLSRSGEYEVMVPRESIAAYDNIPNGVKIDYSNPNDENAQQILAVTNARKEEAEAHRENEAAIIGENEARRERQAIENADNAQSNISEIHAETIETTNRTIAQNELNAAIEREPEQVLTTGGMPITSTSLVQTNRNEASETNDMTTLLTAVQAVTEAVKLKTRAFNTERSAVQLVVEDEVKALDILENKLISIKQTLERLMNNVGTGASDLASGLSNVNINVNYQKTNTDVGNVLATENTLKKILDVVQKTSNSKKQSKSSNKNNSSTKTNSDYKKSTKEDYRGSNWFPDKLKSRIGDLAKFRAQLMTTSKLTDEIDAQIYELVNAMNQVKSGPDLSIWNEKFHQLRTKVGIDKIFDDASDKEDIKIYKELIALKQLEYSIEKKYVKAKDGSVEKQYYENQLTTLRQVITSQNIIKTNDEYELKLAKMKEDHERELGAIKAQQTDADNKEEIKSVENLIDLYKKLGKTIAQRNHAATQEARDAWQQVINAQVAGIRNNPYNTSENRGQFIAAVNEGRNTKDLSLSVQDAKKQGNARAQQEKIDAAQREAEVVRQLVELYKQLGEAQARQNTSLFSQEEADAAKLEAERLRQEIKAKRFDSIDYATDMKFKAAKQSGFDATTTKATAEKENNALKEQETIIKRIVDLHKELGNYQAQAENLDGQEADFWQAKVDEIKEKIIEEKQLLTAFANLNFDQLSQQFEETRKKSKYKKEDSIFLKSLNLEDKTQQNDIKKFLKNYEKLGKLQASFGQTGNLETEEEIKQLKRIIDSEQQRLGLTQQQIAALESRKNIVYKENQELLQSREREKTRQFYLKEQEKAQRNTLKQQLKDAQAEANKNKANSALSAGREAISNIGVTIDTNKISVDTTAKIGQLSKELETLNGLYKSVRDAQNPSDVEKYSQALIDQTAKVKKLTAEVNGLTNEYSELQGDNIKEIGINTLGDKANISDYEDQLTKAVRAAYGAKATITGFDADTKRLSFTIKKGAHEFVNYEAAIRNGDNALVSIQGTTKRTETFLQAITRKTKEIFTYFSGSSIIYKAINEVQKGIQYVRDIDIALTELKKVTDETEESYDKFLKTAAKTADKVGSTIKEVVSSTADFARLGYSMEDAAQMAENAQLLMNVSEFTDISSATDTLISAVQAFSYTADETLHVVDILNKIGNNYAISTADLASSLTRSSAALVAAGGTLEEAVALTAAANAIIQDADSVGNALKVVSMRIRGTSTKE